MAKGWRCRPIIEGSTDSYYWLNEHHLTNPIIIVILIVINIRRDELIHILYWLKKGQGLKFSVSGQGSYPWNKLASLEATLVGNYDPPTP